MNTLTPLRESPMKVRTARHGAGNFAIIETDTRTTSVLLAEGVTPAISLQLSVSDLREQAAQILRRADFIERAAHVLLGREVQS